MMKLKEAVQRLEKYAENEVTDEVCLHIEDNLVILNKPFLKVNTSNGTLYVAEGVWCEKNKDDEFYPDWALTWVWEDKEHPEKYLYFEQDGILISLYNLFNGDKKAVENWETQILE